MTLATISAMDLRKSMGDVLNRVQYAGGRFVIERKGDPIAAIVSIDELRRLEQLEAEREIELMQLARRAAIEEGTVPFDALVEQYKSLHGEHLDLPDHA